MTHKRPGRMAKRARINRLKERLRYAKRNHGQGNSGSVGNDAKGNDPGMEDVPGQCQRRGKADAIDRK